MPLSEHEQRILDEIERRLAAEDPKFARQVSSHSEEGKALRRVKRAAAGFVAGFVLLIVGLLANQAVVVGSLAFVVMLASLAVAGAAVKQVTQASSEEGSPVWLSRLEGRWRKRFERNDEQ